MTARQMPVAVEGFRDFRSDHPGADIPAIMDAFVACAHKHPDSIEAAFKHVEECDWCSRYVAKRSAASDRAKSDTGWWTGDFR